MASSHVQHMQKALDQMNLQLHHVISDITGVTGVAIVEAILAGERNPHTLAALRDRRIKASADTIIKSLVGDYRREYLFTLGQSLEAFRHYQELIAACDREIAQYLEGYNRAIAIALFPFRNPITEATGCLGGMAMHMCAWSGIRCPSMIWHSFCRA